MILGFLFSLPGDTFNPAKAVEDRAVGNTECVTLNQGVYHASSPLSLFPGQLVSDSTTPPLISNEAGDKAVLG